MVQSIAMTLKQQLTEDMKQALRNHDSLRLNTIRLAVADVKNYEIDHGEQNDESVQSLIAKQVKMMKDALEDFARGGRQDLVEEETKKVAVLEAYLPSPLTDDELRTIIAEVKSKMAGAALGQVIGAVMGRVRGRADGGRVAAAVKAT